MDSHVTAAIQSTGRVAFKGLRPPPPPHMALQDQVAVVTGAVQGIGRAMAEILLRNGAKVALLDVNEAAGKSLKEVLDKQHGPERTLFLSCDVESEEQIRAAFQRTAGALGAVDIVCNNAGVLNEAEWEKTISVNLVAVVRVTYIALEHMNKMSGGRGGVIINTASMAGLFPLLSCPVYTATKYGVVGFTRAMAANSTALGFGIRFNALCPGFVQTDILDNIYERLGQFSQLSAETQVFVDKGVLKTSEVAEGLLELLTNDTKNGEALQVMCSSQKYMKFPVFT
uniref:15-hydroxyprostaglandin dehydrogenase [NAD(+)] n=2 Tax=Gasterosteus aculeatus aculeatus TaxID=481459 RepID=A0AAQ4PAH9_GASAC